jgi:DNA-binding transcriptional ArsR family regulator
MPIQFTVDDRPASFRYAISPLAETLVSLHVLLMPKRHPLQHEWVRAMRRLSPGVKRDARALAFLYEDAFPDCLIPTHEGTLPFEKEVARLETLDAETTAYQLARPLYHYHEPAAGGPEALADPPVRQHVVEFAAYHGDESRRLAELLLDDPLAFRGRVVDMLTRYWEEAFASEWARVEPLLLDALDEVRSRVEGGGLFDLLDELRPMLRVERDQRRFVRRSPHEHHVHVTPDEPLLLVSSAYIWPYSRVNCDPPWPLTLMHPAPFVLRAARREEAPGELVSALRALAEPTRLRALRLIAARPRSTEELAPLVGLTEAGLSKHLRALSDAGLVVARRDGYYVLYSVDRARLAAIGGELIGFVDGAGD